VYFVFCFSKLTTVKRTVSKNNWQKTSSLTAK